jgi:hypothetical protein
MATLSNSWPKLLEWKVVVMEVGNRACALLDEEVRRGLQRRKKLRIVT